MRLVPLIPMVVAAAVTACINHVNVQCGQDSDCNLSSGGVCTAVAGTGDRWCAYPDSGCPNGYRFSTLDVGDGVSGTCVAGTEIPNDMVLVPAGPFLMGCNASIEGATVCSATEQVDELPFHSVMLDSFLIDKFEASRAKYNECVNAHVCVATGGEMTSNLPVAVTWQEATTYCIWAGKRLPTEAEWEKTARSDDGRTFPWGSTPPNCTLADYVDCGGGYVTVESLQGGASPYGTLNMAGDIAEWVRDLYQSDYYVTSPSSNPPGPLAGDSNVLRGGSAANQANELRIARRGFRPIGFGGFGFRCARSL